MLQALHFVDGQWSDLGCQEKFESFNPATGELLGTICDAGAAEAQTATAAARRAFDATTWARNPRLRAAVLLELGNRLEAASADIVTLLTRENGKLLQESRVEVANAVSMCRYNAGLARNLFGRVVEVEPDVYAVLPREAIGVAAIIVPWNAPIGLMFRSVTAAIAAGCTFVVKPAPQTALTTAAAFRALTEITALPRGVANLLNESGNDVARTLVASPLIDMISYTGSTEVGKRIMAAAAQTLKRLNLELGGNAPCLLFHDANFEQAVPALVRAGMVFAGQQCVAASRILVHRSRLDEVVERFSRALRGIVVGPGDAPGSQMGPLIDNRNRDRVAGLVADAARTCEVIVRGEPGAGPLAQGSFLTPSLVHIRDRASHLCQEEVFGPVLSLDTFDDEAGAIALAEQSRFGLAASVWSADLQRAQRVAMRLRAGTVWLNGHGRFNPEIEVGGYKESGIGRLFGQQGLDDFLQTKHVSWSLTAQP